MGEKRLLITYTKIYENESLSSWLNRLARENLCTPYVFYTRYLGSTLLNRDIDRFITQTILNKISVLTKTHISKIQDLLIPQYYSSGIEVRKTLLHEIVCLNTKIVGVRKSSKWTQFCPKCLSESNYYRKQWRLAHITTCTKHKLRLYDSCPNCSKQINFHCIHLLHSSKAICDKCFFDLTTAEIISISDKNLLSFENAFIQSMNTNWFKWKSFDMHSSVFVSGLHFLIYGVRKSLFNCFLHNSLCKSNFAYKSLDIQTRHQLMGLIISILKGWPHTIKKLSDSALINQTAFYRDRHSEWPYWLWIVMRTDINKKKYWITETEILSAINFLQNKLYKISLANIGEVLGHDRSFYVNDKNKALINSARINYQYEKKVFYW